MSQAGRAVGATIDEAYAQRCRTSMTLWERQRSLIPGGITHSGRALAPFPLFVTENRGARKWDVDGFEYIDYWMGHGAMLLGHAHPEVVAALAAQAPRGFHAGGESPLTLEWAELVRSMVPSAEMVRFVASGGEATQLAIRVARAHTRKDRIVKFDGAFHGWHDAAAVGVSIPYEVPFSPGIPKQIQDTVVHCAFNDAKALARVLDASNDIAAVLVEPGGCYNDTVPSDPRFIAELRALTQQRNVLLIFDEVVTGFRYSRGGAQEYFGVVPDLTALGKIMGGGLPVGALVGRADVMGVLEWRPDPRWIRYEMVPLPGTWNGNPAVAATGVATLRLVRDTDVVRQATLRTQKLVDGINDVFRRRGVAAFAYGRASIFKIRPGECPRFLSGDYSKHREEAERLLAGWGSAGWQIRKAMLLEGVDLMRTDGYVSAAHTDADISMTCEALDRAITRLREDGSLLRDHEHSVGNAP